MTGQLLPYVQKLFFAVLILCIANSINCTSNDNAIILKSDPPRSGCYLEGEIKIAGRTCARIDVVIYREGSENRKEIVVETDAAGKYCIKAPLTPGEKYCRCTGYNNPGYPCGCFTYSPESKVANSNLDSLFAPNHENFCKLNMPSRKWLVN